jgi:hypothetical protein
VLSITPGNFFALKTWKGRVNTEARTGAAEVLRDEEGLLVAIAVPKELAEAGVSGEVGLDGDELMATLVVALALMMLGAALALAWERPTLTKLNLRLCVHTRLGQLVRVMCTILT